jgi:hypothetical protein
MEDVSNTEIELLIGLCMCLSNIRFVLGDDARPSQTLISS